MPSPVVGSYHNGKEYLVVGCCDGTVRVLKDMCKPSKKGSFFPLLGLNMESMSCMAISGDMVKCFSLLITISPGSLVHRF